jgi:hypothetical protein
LGGVSDHSPILFDLSPETKRLPIPFKFISSWLEDHNYLDIFKKTWAPYNEALREYPTLQILENIKSQEGYSSIEKRIEKKKRKSSP